MSESVLVTGGAGFVGANLARRLVADGHRVHLLVNRQTDMWRLADIADDTTIWTAPLEDRDAVADIVRRSRPHRVFHLAAHGAYPTQRDAELMVRTNIVGTMNLVQACADQGVESIVNTGSSSEYGYKDAAPTETEWLDPNSDYAWTKAAATLYCRYSSLRYRLPITTLRLYSVYGPWEEPTRLMPTLVTQGMQGMLPPLTKPTVARDYIHVDDVVRACLRAARGDVPLGSVFNVATGRQTTLAQLVEIVRRTQSITVDPCWGTLSGRPWDTDVWVGDPCKMDGILGWRAEISIENGYQDFVRWMADPANGRHYRRAASASSAPV